MFKRLSILLSILSICFSSNATNPIKPNFGMADPHIYNFEGRSYLFTTRDLDPKAQWFTMPDWHIFVSDDLVEWEHLTTIYPTDNYMGESTNCWATETVERNGKYYFYFSNGNHDTGVMVADHPQGPYSDPLGKPLLDSSLTSGHEYDPTVLELDGEYYILFGHGVEGDDKLHYFVARLGEDMISLSETPRIVEIEGDLPILLKEDKPNLHVHDGVIYLSSGSHYATATDVYGPYTRVGASAEFNPRYGFGTTAHGNYFTRDNQWFHTWCHFHLGKEVARYRESYITYLHYRKNGEMVSDTVLLDNHFENGVGSYSAKWETIEAEWFMKASREGVKNEGASGGFEISELRSGDFVLYPNLRDLSGMSKIVLNAKSMGGAKIELREDSPKGKLIGKVTIPATSNNFSPIECRIKSKSDSANICVVFKGNLQGFALDSFSFL